MRLPRNLGIDLLFIGLAVFGLQAASAGQTTSAEPSAQQSKPAHTHPPQEQKPGSESAPEQEKEEHEHAHGGEHHHLPHPFFAHMGVPDPVGTFSFRSAGLVRRADGAFEGDFAFHLETGLTPNIGLHIRNDRALDEPRTELMLQFAGYRTHDHMSGVSPVISVEVPTQKGVNGSRVMVGFTTALSKKSVAINQSLEYSPQEKEIEHNWALVFRLGPVFPVLEALGEAAEGERPVLNLLGGLKFPVTHWLHLGLAFRAPVTHRKAYASQFVFQPDSEWNLRGTK